MEDRIHLTIEERIADVRLARPTKPNALDLHADRLPRFNLVLERHRKQSSLAQKGLLRCEV